MFSGFEGFFETSTLRDFYRVAFYDVEDQDSHQLFFVFGQVLYFAEGLWWWLKMVSTAFEFSFVSFVPHFIHP